MTVKYSKEAKELAKELCVKRKYGCRRIKRELVKKYPKYKNIPESTISKWINVGGWRAVRAKVEKKTEEKYIQNAVAENLKELKLIDDALAYIEKDMKRKRVKSNLSNIPELIKLRMLKRGENTENLGQRVEVFIETVNNGNDKIKPQAPQPTAEVPR